MIHHNLRLAGIACVIIACLFGCRSSAEALRAERATEEAVRGPHGGRLLRDGDFAVELAIHERGVPPEYRAWSSSGGKPLDPAAVDLSVELARFGGRKDLFRFSKQGDYLLGDQTVEEPHSFVVTVRALWQGQTHEWRYESFEGRTTISPQNAKVSGVRVEAAGPARIRQRIHAVGRVLPDADALVRVVPRFPGVVREARKRIGDAVAKNEVLAIVEASQSLQSYEVRSPSAGTILSRSASPGEVTADGPIYVVADLSTVWVDLLVKPSDVARVRPGAAVAVAAGSELRGESKIAYVAPTATSTGQAVIARAVFSNVDAAWRPGLFVTAEIVVEEIQVPVAVRASALQTFRDWDVVFLNDGDVYQAMPVELGRRDGDWVEVVAGVDAGARYAAEGSFLVKADIEKSGASHDH